MRIVTILIAAVLLLGACNTVQRRRQGRAGAPARRSRRAPKRPRKRSNSGWPAACPNWHFRAAPVCGERRPSWGERGSMALEHPYLLFLGDAPDQLAAKVAQGIRDWRPDASVGQLRLPGCKADMKLPDMTVAEAEAAGAKTLVIGVANRGGIISDGWKAVLVEAMEAGMDVAAGLHTLLNKQPDLVEAARRTGPHAARRARADRPVPDRRRQEAPRQAAAGGRHRLLVRQDVHGPGAGEGDAGARAEGRFPRHRPDRHPDRRRGRAARRGDRRLHGGRGRVPDARRRRRPLGPDRGPGLAVPRLLFRRDAGADPWRPAGRAGALPRADAHAHARPAALQGAVAGGAARAGGADGADRQPRRAR